MGIMGATRSEDLINFKISRMKEIERPDKTIALVIYVDEGKTGRKLP